MGCLRGCDMHSNVRDSMRDRTELRSRRLCDEQCGPLTFVADRANVYQGGTSYRNKSRVVKFKSSSRKGLLYGYCIHITLHTHLSHSWRHNRTMRSQDNTKGFPMPSDK